MRRDRENEVPSTEEVLERHVDAFDRGDLDGIVLDYASDAVLFTPEGPLVGHGPIRAMFERLLDEFAGDGVTFEMVRQDVRGECAYILWRATTAKHHYRLATDTFVVRAGRIVAQTFAAVIEPRVAS